MAVKARTIWLEDADWTAIKDIAKRRDMNPSNLIRFTILAVDALRASPSNPIRATSQARRDAILRKISKDRR